MSNEKKRKTQSDLRRNFNRNVKEERYASSYERYEPLPHTQYFVNRLTDEKTLNLLIQTASLTNEFAIDTESINIPGKRNEPALIQLLMMHDDQPSSVVVIEPHHLHHKYHPHVELTQKLFELVLSSEKTSYIFGSKNELKSLDRFKLFTVRQIESMTFINLQNNFKTYWQERHRHRHQQTNQTNNNQIENCRCEQCTGKGQTELWSLQDCIANEFHRYLPKIYSNSDFDIGLDPKLGKFNNEELNHQANLIAYACNDCLSMETIIRRLKMKQFKFNTGEFTRARPKLQQTPRMSFTDSEDGEIYLSQLSNNH